MDLQTSTLKHWACLYPSSCAYTHMICIVHFLKRCNGLHTQWDKLSVAVRVCQVPMLWLQKNIWALKPGQYICIRASDFRSAAGCSHHKDKPSLTFFCLESKARVHRARATKLHSPTPLPHTDCSELRCFRAPWPKHPLIDPILPCSELYFLLKSPHAACHTLVSYKLAESPFSWMKKGSFSDDKAR